MADWTARYDDDYERKGKRLTFTVAFSDDIDRLSIDYLGAYRAEMPRSHYFRCQAEDQAVYYMHVRPGDQLHRCVWDHLCEKCRSWREFCARESAFIERLLANGAVRVRPEELDVI